MTVTVVDREQLAPSIYRLRFRSDIQFFFVAGQYINLIVPHSNMDDRGDQRWFSLSSAPSDEFLEITFNTSEFSSTLKAALLRLQAGDQVDMSLAMGDFVLPKDPTIPLVFVAAGIGCTPFNSILRDLQNKNEERDIRMIYGVTSIDNAIYTDTFYKLGDKFNLILKNPDTSWPGLTGELTTERIMYITNPTPEHYIYIAGPEGFVEVLDIDLKKAGINPMQVFTDFFDGYDTVAQPLS